MKIGKILKTIIRKNLKGFIRLNIEIISATIFLVLLIMLSSNLIENLKYERIPNEDELRIFISKLVRPSYNINCDRIFEADRQEMNKAKKILRKDPYKLLNDTNFIFEKKYCNSFKKYRKYDLYNNVSKLEREFPLAFIILTYKEVDQFERLLNRIYRPQNIYCIHVDAKSHLSFKKAIQSIVDCFDNVFIATKLETIVYASYSRLQADINCIEDLVNKNYVRLGKKYTLWKYVINLSSTEYPLKTNYEIVSILKFFNGGNDIEALDDIPAIRYTYIYENQWNTLINQSEIKRTNNLKTSEIPHNFTIRKGSAYWSISYDFAKWTISNKYAKDLLKWNEDVYSPDEL